MCVRTGLADKLQPTLWDGDDDLVSPNVLHKVQIRCKSNSRMYCERYRVLSMKEDILMYYNIFLNTILRILGEDCSMLVKEDRT